MSPGDGVPAMEPYLFQEFIRKGPECASRELRGSPQAQRAFVRRLLQIVPLQGSQTRMDEDVPSGEEYTTWLKWLITSPTESESPEEYIQRVQEQYGAKSNVCGRIWGKGYVAYRCRTCGMSPCSAICHECFEKGPHRNHNFLMYRSVAGGCCDCGDPGAWKATGFCKDHNGPPESFHLPMPAIELRGAFNCIYDLVRHVTEALSAHYYAASAADAEDELPPYCSKSLKLLQELCTYGDVYRRIVCSATLGDIGLANPTLRGGSPLEGGGGAASMPLPSALDSQPAMAKSWSIMSIDDQTALGEEDHQSPGSLLECLMLSGTHLSVEMSTLLLQMLFDFDFKKNFTRVFIRYYGRFMRTILRLHDKKEIPTRMVDISVQLFSNSMLTVQMIREEALLSTLFRNIMALVEEQSEQGADGSRTHMTLNCEHPIWTKRAYWPITNDLVNILSHRAVVSEFLFRVDIVKEWLAVARRFQGIDVHKRQVGAHIELENRHWTSPFFIELELVMEQLSLLDSGVKDLMSHPIVPEPGEPAIEHPHIICAMQQILAIGIKACQEWLAADTAGEQRRSSNDSRPHSLPMRFSVHQDPVTLHIPLHRFVAFFASQVCRHCDLPLQEMLPVEDLPAFIRAVTEHPLRIQVLLAQIRAGLWRMNGETMFRRGWFYRSAYFYDLGFDLDLFILQCAAVLLHPDELLLTLVDRFGLSAFLGFADPRLPCADGEGGGSESVPPSEDVDICTVIAEDMMVLIAAILSERARLGLTDDECIRQEVIARLCVKPHSHSQLTEAICRRWNEHDNFETVLLEVADFEAPKSHRMEQGKYRLKSQHAGERDASLVHILVRSFNHGDYEAAIEQLREAEKADKTDSGVANAVPAANGAGAAAGGARSKGGKKLMMPMPRAFRSILRLLHSPVLHHVLYKVLLHAVSGKSATTSVHIDMALWLLQAALDNSEVGDHCGMQGGDELSSQWGCIFSSRDIRENMLLVVPRAEEGAEPDVTMGGGMEDGAGGFSILTLLKAMQQSEHFVDARPTPASLLALFARSSAGSEEQTQAETVAAEAASQDLTVSLLACRARVLVQRRMLALLFEMHVLRPARQPDVALTCKARVGFCKEGRDAGGQGAPEGASREFRSTAEAFCRHNAVRVRGRGR
jgi:E3 ubiquitin-protein ligase UBR3